MSKKKMKPLKYLCYHNIYGRRMPTRMGSPFFLPMLDIVVIGLYIDIKK